MYAYIELSNIARTDSIIESLSWMNSISTSSLGNISEGWLATGNRNHIVSVTYTSIKSDENSLIPDRTNFNLRAHRTAIRFVSWNIPYQKLTTIDDKGVIFVWVKHDNRWTLELINDRNHPVIDMSWSYDGRMTVICYEDGYILVGSVTGQRYWSTVLNIPNIKISAVTWMPDVLHVILGTTSGQLIIIDHHGNISEICSISTKSIKQLMYSCNKFYPEALDNNATKFNNDDYILACSLENGQILFLNNYQDQSPIIIETNLQNIRIDWSFQDEILVVGGYKYLNNIIYNNQILFYNRRGEFLYHLSIPQITQPLSALCWAHGNEIVFVACGSFVYTIWIIHKCFPSMLTLCQMKIKENLLKNSLENFDKLFLPKNLKENLFKFYRSTIKGFLPNQNSLHSFVCNPLKSNLRLQCTMKRIDNDKEKNSSTKEPVYILYLEYLGGLIPLLIAKRISKIYPNFIIFHPKINNLLLKSSLIKLNNSIKKHFFILKSRSNLIINQNSIYIAETNVNNNQTNFLTTKNNSNSNSNLDDENINHLQEKQSKKENSNKLCTITANIWGTRFTFYGHSNHLPEIVGSVTYRTSFLHLQPRQMIVTLVNNSNIYKRTISPPCIQVKQSLSRRLSSTDLRTALLINDDRKIHSNISESCFEPDTYRNNQQKKCSFSDRISRMNEDIEQINNQNETSFYVMQNRPPLWNDQSQVYQLDFGGRVTLESAKNFQIEFQGKQVIQFGRIENNCYTLDFEWPFSPLQAFAVALANITQRLK